MPVPQSNINPKMLISLFYTLEIDSLRNNNANASLLYMNCLTEIKDTLTLNSVHLSCLIA